MHVWPRQLPACNWLLVRATMSPLRHYQRKDEPLVKPAQISSTLAYDDASGAIAWLWWFVRVARELKAS